MSSERNARVSSSMPGQRNRSRDGDTPHLTLVKLIRAMMKAGKTLRDGKDKPVFASGSEGKTKVGEVYAIFSGGFESSLALWCNETQKPNDPSLHQRVTDQLISIFSGTAAATGTLADDGEAAYRQLYDFWRSTHADERAKVVEALQLHKRELLRRQMTAEGTRASQQITAAAEALDVERINSSTRRPDIRVYQSEPPIGRDHDRDAAILDLKRYRGLVLFGAPGQGKTALARYIALTSAGNYKTGVYEVDLESERQIENLPRLIANALGHPDIPGSYDLLHRMSSLVILDGLDNILSAADPAKLRTSLRLLTDALSQDSRVIITCQKRFEKEGLVTREVRPLSQEHALSLFHRFSEGLYTREADGPVSSFVTGDLAAHPLSIKIVGRYGSDLKLPFGDLKRLWNEKWLMIAQESPPSIDDRGLLTAFELTYASLSQTEQLLFLTLSLLPDGISPELIRAIWPQQESESYDALKRLRHRSLLEDDAIHPTFSGRLRGPLFRFALTKKLLLEGNRGNGTTAKVERAAAAIDQYFDHYVTTHAPQYTDADPRQKNELIRSHFHNIHSSVDRRLKPSTRPETIAAARSVLSLYWAYHNNLSGANNPISSTEDATTYLSKAADIFQANKKSEEATKCRYYIGNILWLRGDIPGAQAYLRETEESAEADEKIRCDSRRAFAHIEYKQGDINRSIDQYLTVAESANRIKYESCALRCQIGLLDAYRKLGKLDLGLQTFEAMKDAVEAYGPDLRGNALRGFAYLLAEKENLSAAESEYQKGLRVFEGVSLFGQAHCQRGLGDVYVKMGRFAEAEIAFDASMRLYDDAQKNPSLGVGLLYLGRSRLALAQKRFEESAQWCRHAAELFGPQQ